jgi:hypothetical protein
MVGWLLSNSLQIAGLHTAGGVRYGNQPPTSLIHTRTVNSSSETGAALGEQRNSQWAHFAGYFPVRDGIGSFGALDVLQDITDQRCLEDAHRGAERISAFARAAMEVAQLKPALPSMAHLLDSLVRDATLRFEARGYTELAQIELGRFDALAKCLAHLAGVA